MKLPLTYDNYIFDLYGTLVDIHTDESDTAIWEKLAMFYGYYGALYEAKEFKERYETLVKSSEAELKKKIEKSDADAQFAISYAHEASPEIQRRCLRNLRRRERIYICFQMRSVYLQPMR